MGYRLHVRKINRIEYSTGSFNNMGDSVMPVLHDFPGDHWVSEDDCRLEINKDDFRDGIRKLKEMTSEQFKASYPRFTPEMTKEELVETLEELLEEADPDGDVVALDWF